ncbi:MAG: VWA domain-containing protein [Flavisolibacter sp.]
MLYNWLEHIEFKNQWVLPFLLGLVVIAWFYFRTSLKHKATFTISTIDTFTIRSFKNSILYLPLILRLLALACILIALARPQVRNVLSKKTGQGIDIILCMDVSGSMLSGDFYPNRLEVAKQMAADFVKSRPIDQIGLVIFAGESYTQFPLSTDYESLLDQINNLRSGMLIDGTVIGEGLATSVERLSSSKSKSKVIILLTDGNEQPPETRVIDPLTGLAIAKTKGVKVYTIGMGVLGPTSSVKEKGVSNLEANGFLDESLLRKIAMQTGGQYYRAIDKESLQEIYNQINQLEKSKIEVITTIKFEEEFFYFMVVALILLLLEIILKYTFLRTFP